MNQSVFRAWAGIACIVMLMCAAFGATASCMVLAFQWHSGEPFDAFAAKTILKLAAFLVVLTAAGWGIIRFSQRTPEPPADSSTPVTGGWPLALLAFAVATAAVFPRLAAYPAAGPDELHHLTVARNLALHHAYASGHPDGVMIPFDNYDSVGATVIGPVAGVFRIAGVSLTSGRIVMGLHYVLLCVAMYLLLRGHFGGNPAAVSILLMTGSFGSIYLGRTLYGEVPALAWFACGLWLWRRALNANSLGAAALAGIAFGLAVLTKTVIMFSAFAFFAVYAHDLFNHRRIPLRCLITPAAAGVAVVAAWWAIKASVNVSVSGDTAATLAVYRNNLAFSLRMVPAAAQWLFINPTGLAGAIALIWALSATLRRRYDPVLAVLTLAAVFYLFWWVCFTPVRIPRYIWYSIAIGGCFTGCLLYELFGAVRRLSPYSFRRYGLRAAGILLAAPYVCYLVMELIWVHHRDEMRDERALVHYVQALPPERAVATPAWPVAGILNFMANRHVPIKDDSGRDGAIVIYDGRRYGTVPQEPPDRQIGRYLIYEE